MNDFSHLKNKLLAEQIEDQIYHYILDTPQFIESVARMAPKRVVYVSCNPETMARDLALLTKKATARKASPRSERERPLYCTGQAQVRHQGAGELQQA